MKRTFFIALVMCAVSSCLGTGENSWSYTLDMTFDDAGPSSNVFGADSLSVLNESGMILGADFSLALLYKQQNDAFQGGFRLSRLKGEADGKLERPQTDMDAWRVNAAGGAVNRYSNVPSTTYAVFYDNPDDAQMPAHDMEFGYKDNGTCTMGGCYVNNTTLVARKIREHFQDGDKLVMKATGYKTDGSKTGVSEIVLAEYSALRDTVIYNWTVFDLSKLGAVEYVDFEVISTNPEVPGYACVDGILANIAVSY